ncbi:MAG: MORN repeat variant [Bacteroidetes bacterium ADurb.Bin217]|nr:MAG: MORN repeat variant [Bacteroidetes bacterium ADurb.Bin217]
MKLYLIFLIFSITIISGYAQVEYSIIYSVTCDDTTKYYNGNALLVNSLGEMFYSKELPDTGIYYMLNSDFEEIYEIHLNEYKIYIDTILGETIEFVRWVSNPPVTYYLCCSDSCNGNQKSYYPNGNIKYDGNFKNGNENKFLKEYYFNGNLKYEYYKNLFNYSSTNYYENGQIEYVFTKNTISRYNKNGLKIYHSKRNKIKYKIDINKDGSIKAKLIKNKIFYYKNDTLKSIVKYRKTLIQWDYCWDKLLFWEENYCGGRFFPSKYNYLIKYKEFNSNNNLIIKACMIARLEEPNKIFEIYKDIDWVRRIKIYESGKLAFKERNISIDKILNKLTSHNTR